MFDPAFWSLQWYVRKRCGPCQKERFIFTFFDKFQNLIIHKITAIYFLSIFSITFFIKRIGIFVKFSTGNQQFIICQIFTPFIPVKKWRIISMGLALTIISIKKIKSHLVGSTFRTGVTQSPFADNSRTVSDLL